jgi:hypothetical protein
MAETSHSQADASGTVDLSALWEEHVKHEFATRNT